MKITAYEFGRVAVDDVAYTSDVIIWPDGVSDHWWRREGHTLSVHDLADVIAAKPDVLVVGTGFYGRMKIPEETRRTLEQQGIEVRTLKTGDAVMDFNALQKEYARVVAALHLTC